VRVAKNDACGKLLIATTNSGKIVEIRDLLRGQPWTVVDPVEINISPEIEETGQDYAENAALKARGWAEACGCWVLADDSGLEVDALGGEPGLHSARFAGPDRTDAERRQYLLQKLQPLARPWTARFVACAAAASPDGFLEYRFGTCSGAIIPEERGTEGFGYDPIFLVEDTGKTMAELSMFEKNQISHRARAIRALLPILLETLM
jgi:XTP/dITP diphosphohydrolase